MSLVAAPGMLVVDKPAGCTSHDVVLKVRERLDCRAGHTGTLDPRATGVLLVCVDAATRLTRFLQQRDKVYDATVRLGWATDSYDGDGEALAEPVKPPSLDRATVVDKLAPFLGQVDQVPPVYSAKKVRGQPSYRRVRRGETVVHEPVKVHIYSIDVTSVDDERVGLRVHCGSGTYVRTLAHDLGQAIGCPSHLETLRRVRVGEFGLEGAVSWEDLLEAPAESLAERVVGAGQMLPEWPEVVIGKAGTAVLHNGGVIEPSVILERAPGCGGATVTGTGKHAWVRVLAEDRHMLAAAEVLPGGILQPRIVLG